MLNVMMEKNTPPLFKKINGDILYLDGRVAYIMNMYTLPEYRRKGIAKILFDKLVEEAKILGYRKNHTTCYRDG